MTAEDERLLEELVAALESAAPRPLSVNDLARRLELERYDRRGLVRLLEGEVERGRLRRVGKTRYQFLRPIDVQRVARRTDGAARDARSRRQSALRLRHHAKVEGRYSRTRSGYGFVAVLGEEGRDYPSDIFIPAGDEGEAMHGDVVEARIVRRTRGGPRGGDRVVGEIVRVVRRAAQLVVGELRRSRMPRLPGTGGRRSLPWVLLPDSDVLPVFAVEGGIEPSSQDEGRLAVGRVVRGPAPPRPPVVSLERILGDANDPEVQFLTIALEHGLRIEFPPEVAAEAERLPLDPAESDFAGREDLRALPFVTIDGETARDFDDAVCLEPRPNGGQRLWVAIADVSHYVRPGSALDGEAILRGTSVYFPDRAIPMLPERLSNELCSLKPDRDRLVMAVAIDYDRHGERQGTHFTRGVIRSRARLTYTQVAAVLSSADTPQIDAWRAELAPLLDQLRRMHELMRRLYARRMAAGSLDLDLPEALVDLSEEGRTIGLRLSQRNDAHRMIEEFMLEANQAVARHLEERGVPLPYRIHEPPRPDDIDALNDFLAAFGMHVDYEQTVEPPDVQRVLRDIAAHPLTTVLSRQVLRSLTQARYSTENVGHFGLAFRCYCHFTSPIRRYPDLLVHRQLGLVLDGRVDVARAQGAALEPLADSSSQREREAVDAERAMLDLKKAEFMLGHLLEPEPAVVVGVAPFGIFVELEAYPVEGLIRAEDLPERLVFDERAQMLVARRSGERFRLGDRLMVEATDVSLKRRQVTFALVERLTRAEEPPRKERPEARNEARRDERRARKAARRGEQRGARPAKAKQHAKARQSPKQKQKARQKQKAKKGKGMKQKGSRRTR
ncbi:MAG TPA: ribonuclease R [Candidatus Binatia bacterium]